MPDADRYELVDGQLVERNICMWSSYVAGALFALLYDYCRRKQLGWTSPEASSNQCFAEAPSKVRRPDVSFISGHPMTLAQATEEGHIPVAPDLAVEVISPNDLAYEIDANVNEYLGAGVRLVWIINPQAKSIAVHRPVGAGIILRESDSLDGEDVLPGFRCLIAELFQPPSGVEA